jgi:hypothetical protein
MTSREGTRHLPGVNQERRQPPTFAETLKRHFRQVVRTITVKATAPHAPQQNNEDTGRAFRQAARNITRRAFRIPAVAYATAAHLWDTLHWLNPWHHDRSRTSQLSKDGQHNKHNHLSLHL